MTTHELKQSLAQLLALEENEAIDWDQVQDSSINLLAQLRTGENVLDYPAELVIPYLTDFPMRKANQEEALRQRRLIVAYLREN